MHSPSLGSLVVPIRFVRYHNIQMFLDSSADILSMCRLNINGWQVKKSNNQSWVWNVFSTGFCNYFFSPSSHIFQNAWKDSKSRLARVILVEVSGREQLVFSLCTVSLYPEKNSHSDSIWSNKVASFYLENSLHSDWALIWAIRIYRPFQFPFWSQFSSGCVLVAQ